MLTVSLQTIAQLIELIIAGNPDPTVSGDKVLVLATWQPDGRKIVAHYCKDPNSMADIDTFCHPTVEQVRPHAEALINNGKPIRVLMLDSDDTVYMIWTVVS
jgi:hypothetical protein